MPKLAQQHRAIVADHAFMVEFEFLDEANRNERFLRLGTDPRGMVQPMALRP
jgi:predicted urease superfamily metal-dependent hydrolase